MLERINPFERRADEAQLKSLGHQMMQGLISAARTAGFRVHDKRKK